MKEYEVLMTACVYYEKTIWVLANNQEEAEDKATHIFEEADVEKEWKYTDTQLDFSFVWNGDEDE